MRLQQIEIKDYNQFEHLVLDLTYPKGHKKAGKPLDKICIIGDNGTGKTTILNFIRDYYESGHLLSNVTDPGRKGIIEYHLKPIKKLQDNGLVHYTGIKSSIPSLEYNKINSLLLFFPTGPDLTTIRENELRAKITQSDFGKKKIFDLSDTETFNLWINFRNELKKTFDTEIEIRKDIFNQAVLEGDVNTIREAADKLEKYQKDNPNNLQKFKKFIDPILNCFCLELDAKINFENIQEEFFLKIKAKDGQSVPIDNWSTGIRQLIYNILPLYSIETDENTIVLIDEPERSLYPNTQKILVDFYTEISPKSQFIYATHSPIIASSFEPWEVIELQFNEKGKVERKLYYNPEKENHVDNYFIHPQYLRWDSLFEKMFGLSGESNPKRIKMLMDLAILEQEIKKEVDKEKKKELWHKYEKMANILDWKTIDDAEN